MLNIDLERLLYAVQIDFQTEVTKIAGQVFSDTQFQLSARKIGKAHAALVVPQIYLKSLHQDYENIVENNLAITFKSQNRAVRNFQVNYLPKINILTISGYYKEGTAYLCFSPGMNPNWYNGRGYKIARPDCIGEKFELLANKFYPFLEEFFAL
ncbi:hypothetical protein H6G97_49445 [Nostoc flagelliforme FACHB-838]|uniref:DUF4365 domain-containing protein n=1 Tax=Nostoc flagelliforme FACHB-838 TaxID=2692904 RepID=A0ABR8E898_9NOSO|nr:hypothetical protein [Nostoc flagelliforme]MBD2536833.1 hypothetical protein [Nostoc flagelliforme FACHB-838]